MACVATVGWGWWGLWHGRSREGGRGRKEVRGRKGEEGGEREGGWLEGGRVVGGTEGWREGGGGGKEGDGT